MNISILQYYWNNNNQTNSSRGLIYDTRKQVDNQKSVSRLHDELSLIMVEYGMIWFVLKSLTIFVLIFEYYE